jgi:hypothetical protein
MRTRSYSVVGQLCGSEAEARRKLAELREADPANKWDWGVAKVRVSTGERPYEMGKIQLPPSPAFLKKLEGLLFRKDVFRKTKAGREALRAVRAALSRS